MLNFKQNFYIAGVFALCIFAACSSENPSTAGSTTIPNATAEKDSIIFEGDKPIIPEFMGLCYSNQGSNTATLCGSYLDTSFYEKIVTFKTESTSLSSDADSLDIKVYSEEKGAAATCSVGDQSFDAKFKISSSFGYILKRLTMHNVGTACDSILHEFQESCNTNPKIKVDGGFNGFCTPRGDLYAFCADFSYVTMECSEAGLDGTKKCHAASDSPTVLETDRFIQEFVQKTESVCSDITDGMFDVLDFTSSKDYYTPGHNPIDYLDSSNKVVPIDTASFTLEKYEELFAESGKEYKFDRHVIAYRVLPSSEVSYDTAYFAIVKDASPLDVATYFPKTSAIMGDKFNPEFCNIYIITVQGVSWPMASVLTDIRMSSYGDDGLDFSVILPTGKCMKSETEISEVLLIKSCDVGPSGFETIKLDGSDDLIDSSLWKCDENGNPQGRPVNFYGEWIRADLIK